MTAEVPVATSSPDVVAAPTASPAEDTQVPPTVAPPLCPAPYVTADASAEPQASPAASDQETPTPIRIRHAVGVPARPLAASTDASPALRPDAALEQLIRDRLGSDLEHYAVVVDNLRDGREVRIDADRVFYAASLFKLEVMYEIFRQREVGLLNFGEQYVASDYYSRFDVGPHIVTLCDRVTVAELLMDMMSVSDNVAAVMLQDRAGAGNVNDAMAALGLTQTRLTEDGSLPATAGDIAQLVAAIAGGDAESAEASREMTGLMATETINDRIPARLPAGTIVAHKTGNWDDATHDAGIVFGAKGNYVMVLLSDVGYGGGAARVEADVARIAFDYFEQQQ